MKTRIIIIPLSLLSVVAYTSAQGAALTVSITGGSPIAVTGNLETKVETYTPPVKTNVSGNASSSVRTGTNTETDASANLTISINGDRERDSATTTLITSESQVSSETDLKLYMGTLVRRDANIEAIASDDTRVSITRRTPAKLFGFIPYTITETVDVMSSGDGQAFVTVNRSWLRVVSSVDVPEETVVANIEKNIDTIPSAQLTAKLDAPTKAMIISRVEAGLAASTDLSGSVSP